MALISFLLGLLSFLALTSPILWILPPVTVVFALSAFRIISTNPDKSGRRLAAIGLFLGVGIGLWATTHFLAREWYLYGKAREFADDWLNLVQDGELLQAHQLHRPYLERVGQNIKLDEYYESMRETSDHPDEFYAKEPLEEFVKNADRSDVQYVGRNLHLIVGETDNLSLDYVVTYDNDGPHTIPMTVDVERVLNYTNGRHYWRVARVRP